MPDDSERKRLRKKMLDRWENEGGRIAADSSLTNQSKGASQREGEGDQAFASDNSSRTESLSSRKRRRALTHK
jgi:hypothetical protein